MRTPPSILLYGQVPELLETRHMVLVQAGFSVTSALSSYAALKLLSTQTFDLLILCHTVSSGDCEEVLQAVHCLRPETRTLLLGSPASPCKGSAQDVHLSSFVAPAVLLREVRGMTVVPIDI